MLWFSTLANFLYTWQDGKIEEAVDLNYRGGIIYYLFGDSREELWVSQAPSDNPIIGVLKVSREGELVEYDEDDGLETRYWLLKNPQTEQFTVLVEGQLPIYID